MFVYLGWSEGDTCWSMKNMIEREGKNHLGRKTVNCVQCMRKKYPFKFKLNFTIKNQLAAKMLNYMDFLVILKHLKIAFYYRDTDINIKYHNG